MVTIEYGQEKPEVVLLLHGGGLSWWNYREAAEILKDDYHVVIPILDGHGGSDRDFLSIADCAEALIRLIDERFEGQVSLLGGVSLGGQFALEMLSRRGDICSFAMIESALTIPMRLTNMLTKPMLDMSYGLIQKPWFAKLQFRYLKIKPSLFQEYYRDTCAITRENMTAFLKANLGFAAPKELERTKAKVSVYVGGREPRIMRRSAERLHRMVPGSHLTVFPDWYHGEFSINHPDLYAKEVKKLLKTS